MHMFNFQYFEEDWALILAHVQFNHAIVVIIIKPTYTSYI